jgi:hypothetical protein
MLPETEPKTHRERSEREMEALRKALAAPLRGSLDA